MLENLNESEITTLEFLSLVWEPFKYSEFNYIFANIDFKTKSTDSSPSAVNKVREILVKNNYLKKVDFYGNTFYEIANNQLKTKLAFNALKNPLHENSIHLINKILPVNDYFYNSEKWRQNKRLLRNYRFKLLTNDWQESQKIAVQIKKLGLREELNQVHKELFFLDFNPLFISNFPVEFQEEILKIEILSTIDTHSSSDHLFAYLQGKNHFNNIKGLAEGYILTLTGQFENAKKILDSTDYYNSDLLLGVIACMELDFETSKTYFENGIKKWRSINNTRKKFPNTWEIFIYALTLLKINLSEYENFKYDFNRSVENEEEGNSLYYGLTILSNYLHNKKGDNFLSKFIETKTLNEKIILILASNFLNAKIEIPNFNLIGKLFHENSYDWLFFEWACNPSSYKKIPDELSEIANKCLNQQKYNSIYNIFPRKEEWEKSLEKLEVIIYNQEIKDEKNSRVAWFINFKNEEIEVKEQKLGKKGYLAGKNISLKRLFEKNVDSLREEDIKAVDKGLEVSRYGYYDSMYFEFDFEKTLEALIGHPNVFLKEDPFTKLELISEEPNLQIEKKGEKLVVFFDKKIKDEISISKITKTKYNVFKATPLQQKIAQILDNKKLEIPFSAKEKLLNIIKPLSSKVAIQSDLEEYFENLPEIPAKSQIHALIYPTQEGFQLEMYVKPFGKTPPYLKPGKGLETITAEIDGVKTKTKRKLKEEKNNLAELEKTCTNLFSQNSNLLEWNILGIEDCLTILEELETPQNQKILVLEWPKGKKISLLGSINPQNISIKVSGKADWFEINGEARVNENLVITFQQLAKLMQSSSSNFIELSTGQYISLTEKLRKKIVEINNLVDDKNRMHVLRSDILENFSKEIPDFKSDKAWKDHISRIENARNYKPTLPPTFEADLRPYQIDGFNWLASLAHWGVGACLADDMGLGKTVQALALLTLRAEQGPALVVAPVSVCRNWIKEAARFAPTLNFSLFGDGNRQYMLENLQKFDVLVVSYSLLQSEDKLFKNKNFATILLDEAQAIKNRQTKRSKTAMSLNGDFKIVTTGTPIENNLGELWNLFNFLNPAMLGSYDFFQERFAIPIEKYNDINKKQALQRLIKPFILRRKKNQVLDDLPSKTEITLTVSLSEEERSFYEALRRNAMENLANVDQKDQRFKILAELTKLRLACCNPNLVNPELGLSSSKLELFGETLNELIENNHKALVFSQFTKHLSLIEQYLNAKKIPFQYLDGSTPSNIRQERIDAFQKGEGDVFLISLKAGGTGLNLTAADYVIHLDPWWNPAVEDQASDRAHRMGQLRPVTVYRLVTENTIEEKILKLHETKRDLADGLLEGTDQSSKMSIDDLLNLIKEN